ncbi:hypothetical protein AB0D04_24145 [Streptomyces sp. NPDC048483]|uniref:hypothetical protein n=1 Tax=Streptomyces sp. NPDC048483 TaxID=3154927 RepID=UPI0034317C36
MDSGRGLPSLELEVEQRNPGEEALQRQVRSWARLPPAFAVGVPWMWLYLAFSDGLSTIPPILAVVLTHAALALVWFGRRRGRRVLTWVGIGCYLLAVALCMQLAKVL